MAAIEQAASKSGTKPRARKHGFHLDMTPMVDLAFLLLTFFMLTTTFAKPRIMQLTMPVKDPQHQMKLKPSQAMTVILGKDHQVYYYFGLNAPTDPTVPKPTLHTTGFQPQGIRQALLLRHQQARATTVLIATAPGATYRDMVDILDEMTITDQGQYALVDLSAADHQLLPATAQL
ncbi:MAG: ExbD/TolR family protein [Janthinobacterium lividum]